MGVVREDQVRSRETHCFIIVEMWGSCVVRLVSVVLVRPVAGLEAPPDRGAQSINLSLRFLLVFCFYATVSDSGTVESDNERWYLRARCAW